MTDAALRKRWNALDAAWADKVSAWAAYKDSDHAYSDARDAYMAAVGLSSDAIFTAGRLDELVGELHDDTGVVSPMPPSTPAK
jgi:hypothetical protein